MKIVLLPIASNTDTVVFIDGLIVTVDGILHNLSAIPEGGQAEAEDEGPFFGIVTREEVKIKYFYNSSTAEPNQSTDIADYTFDMTSGPVPDPIVRKPVPVEPLEGKV